MNTQFISTWLGQKTTGAGLAAILGTLSGVAAGSVSWHAAVPILVAGVVGLIVPENTGLTAAASTLALDTETLIGAYRMGLGHGAVLAPAVPTHVAEPVAAPAPVVEAPKVAA